jgi:hypothetical protein
MNGLLVSRFRPERPPAGRVERSGPRPSDMLAQPVAQPLLPTIAAFK